MSLVFNDCDEQYIGYEQLLILLTQVDNDGNPYINIVDSGDDIDNLQQPLCGEYTGLLSLLKRAIVFDDEGNYAINTATIEGAGICNLRLDFQHTCNSQYLTVI